MTKPSVYIENSVISYLTGRPSRNIVVAAWQEITRDWWEMRSGQFTLFASQLVLDEAQQGDADMAKQRLQCLETVAILPITDDVESLALAFLKDKAVPRKANADAVHIAIAVVHGVDYLLTWNCTHIDNAQTKPLIRSVCAVHGHTCPEICTPQELMGENYGRDHY